MEEVGAFEMSRLVLRWEIRSERSGIRRSVIHRVF